RYSGHFRRKATVRLAHDEIVIVRPALIPGRCGVTSAFASGGGWGPTPAGPSQSFAREGRPSRCVAAGRAGPYDDAELVQWRRNWCSAAGRTMTTRGVPTRPSGWPVLRTPGWMFAAGAVLVAGLTLAAIPHHPSTAQRTADLRTMVRDLNTDVESCAGGVRDSITALRAVQSGASNDVATAVKIADTGAANCSPANSMPMEDLVQYQAPESLASFHLQAAVNDLVTWGFPLAQRVQTDVAAVVTATTADAARRASAQLGQDQQALDAQRDRIYRAIDAAGTSLSAHAQPPPLPD